MWAERFRVEGGVDEIVVGSTHLSVAGQDVVVSHFPYAGFDPRPDHQDRFESWRPQDEGKWLLCGHVHGAWRQSGRMINVGVDAWGGRLVSEPELASLFAAGPASREAQPWRSGRFSLDGARAADAPGPLLGG